MSKHDDFLTEVAYEIDEIIYDYYTKSNQLIAVRRNQDKLIDYRDKTIDTINDMNVRSLKILAGLKKEELVHNRSEILIARNEDILISSLEVIRSTAIKNDFLTEVGEIANAAYKGAVDAVNQFAGSETFATIKDSAAMGYTKLKDTISNISNDPKVKDGIKVTKEKSKELISASEDFAQSSGKKLKDWLKADEEKIDDFKEEVEEFKEDVEDFNEDVKEETSDVIRDYQEDLKDLKEDLSDLKADFLERNIQESDDKVENENEELSLIEEAQKQIDKINEKNDLENEE